MTFFKRLFTAPVFDNEIKTQQAYILHVILWTLVCVPIPFVIYTLLFTPDKSSRTFIQVAFGETINIFLLFLLRRGYVRAASIIQVSAFWFFFTVTAVTGNGVQGEAYLLGYGLVIAIAGILLGGLGTSVFTVLSLAAGGWMAYNQMQGTVNFRFEDSPITTWVVSLVLFPVGAVLQYLASHNVRTALDRARASEEKYRLISQVSSDYTFATEVYKDGSASLSWVAGAFEKMTGYTFEEYVKNGSWLAHVHPDDLEKDGQDMERLYKNQDIKSEIRTFTKNGEIRWEQIFAHPVWDKKENRLVGIFGAVRDITEQKEIEARLAHERDLLQIFMDNIPDTVYFKDIDSRFIRINNAQAKFLGLEYPQDAIGRSDQDFQKSELSQEFMSEERQIIETGKAVLNRIEFNPKIDGEPRWLSATKVPVKDDSGNVIGIIGVSRDITDQKESQEKLQKIFLQQAAILNNIPDMAWLKDKESRYIAVNEQFAKTAGVKSEDILGKTDFEIWNKSFAEKYRKDDIETMRIGQRRNTEELQTDNSGREYWVETSKTPILNADGEVIGTTGIAREITERKKAQETESQRRIMLEKVVQLGKRVTESDDLKSTIKKIWRGVHDDLGFDRLAIFLYNPENNQMDDTIGTDNAGEMVEHWDLSFPLDSTFATLLKSPNGLYFTVNYDVENNIPEGHEMHGVKDYAAVAAWAGDKPVAVICTDHDITKRPITGEQLEALRLFAGYAGLAIENARLNEKIKNELFQQIQAKEREEHRREMLEKVIQLGQRVTEVSDLRTTLIRIWHGVHDDLGFDRLGIHLYNNERKSMDGTFGTNTQGEMTDEWNMSYSMAQDNPDSNSFLRVFEKPDTISLTHTFETDYNIPEGHSMSGVKDHAAIGARAGEKPVAVISVDNQITGRRFAEEQLEALRLFAGYAGLAIENARLNELIQKELAQQIQAKEQEGHRREMLEKVVILGQRVTEVSDLRTTLIRIWHGVHDDLGFDRLGIYLYNIENLSMDGTFGTNFLGEIIDEWHTRVSLKQDDSEANRFLRVLEKPNAIFLTQNYENDYQPPQDHIMAGVKDFAAIAAWAGEKPVAVICVDHAITGRPISEEQLEALRLFAGYAGLSIENARLNSALQIELAQQKQTEERESVRRTMLEKVVQLGKQVTEVHGLKTTLSRIWHGIHDELGFDRLAIFLYNQENNSVNGTLGTNNQGEIVEEWEYSQSLSQGKQTSFTKALEQPDGVFFTKNFGTEFNIPEGHEMHDVKDFAAVTAWGGDKPVAIITVDNLPSQRPITNEQLEALRLFGGYAGLAIENARLNTALEDDLSHRKNLIKELESKNAELERFTYTVSHDLKSPLVTIRGFLGYLEKDARSGDFKKFNQDVVRIETAVEKMQNLLKDLLELSRIGRLMNTPVEIPFDDIVNDTLEIVHGQLKEGGVFIDYQNKDVMIKCDRIRMTEVLQNLIDNAIKFMGPQPSPRIEIGAFQNNDNENVFYVKDNGIGIAPEFHGKIFGLFDKLTADSDGTGIGLALVKRIIEVHGGRIWVESQIGTGAAFYFTLP